LIKIVFIALPGMTEPSRYESRGVSSDKNEVHHAIRHLDRGLFRNTFCKILPNIFSGDPEAALMLHADTAGTKTILAYLYWKETGDLSVWKGIAQDALVMNLDDMACSGPVNRFYISNTVLRNKNRIPGEVLEALVEGTLEFADSMKAHDIHLHHAGGETADVGDVVRTLDVGFTAYSELSRSSVFEINIRPGDLILGIGSFGRSIYEPEYNSGIGCNGLTSARHDVLAGEYGRIYPESFDASVHPDLVYSGTYRMIDRIETGDGQSRNVGQLLLSPTRTFLPLLYPLLKRAHPGLHGIIHCTGGAHSKVLKFVNGLKIIKDRLCSPPPVFSLIQKCSKASLPEMYKVFNMGIRLEIYGTESCLAEVAAMASALNLPNQIIGRVETGSPNEVELKVGDQSWSYF
jgi:phosphoribosylformylglycinamidine cyclo-ligase